MKSLKKYIYLSLLLHLYIGIMLIYFMPEQEKEVPEKPAELVFNLISEDEIYQDITEPEIIPEPEIEIAEEPEPEIVEPEITPEPEVEIAEDPAPEIVEPEITSEPEVEIAEDPAPEIVEPEIIPEPELEIAEDPAPEIVEPEITPEPEVEIAEDLAPEITEPAPEIIEEFEIGKIRSSAPTPEHTAKVDVSQIADLHTRDIQVESSRTPQTERRQLESVEHSRRELDLDRQHSVSEQTYRQDRISASSSREVVDLVESPNIPVSEREIRRSRFEDFQHQSDMSFQSPVSSEERVISRDIRHSHDAVPNHLDVENIITQQPVEINRSTLDEQLVAFDESRLTSLSRREVDYTYHSSTQRNDTIAVRHHLSDDFISHDLAFATQNFVDYTSSSTVSERSIIQRNLDTSMISTPEQVSASTPLNISRNELSENIQNDIPITQRSLRQNIETAISPQLSQNNELRVRQSNQSDEIIQHHTDRVVTDNIQHQNINLNRTTNVTDDRRRLNLDTDENIPQNIRDINRRQISESNVVRDSSHRSSFEHREVDSSLPASSNQPNQIQTRRRTDDEIERVDNLISVSRNVDVLQPASINVNNREGISRDNTNRELLNDNNIVRTNREITRHTVAENIVNVDNISSGRFSESQEVERTTSRYDVSQAETRQASNEEISSFNFETDRLSGYSFRDEQNIPIRETGRSGLSNVSRQSMHQGGSSNNNFASGSYEITQDMINFIGSIIKEENPEPSNVRTASESIYQGIEVNPHISITRNIDGRYNRVEDERDMQHGLGRQSIGITADYSTLQFSEEYLASVERHSNIIISRYVLTLQNQLLPHLHEHYGKNTDELQLRVLLRFNSSGNIRSFNIRESMSRNRTVRRVINDIVEKWDIQLPIESSAQVYIWLYYEKGDYNDINIFWNH